MNSHSVETVRSWRRFPILYGVTWSLACAVAGTLITALWAHMHPLSDRTVVIIAYVIHCGAVLVGALAASRSARERGWYYGGLTGLVYAVLVLCLDVVLYHSLGIGADGWFRLFLMAVIGAFAGIIGVNTVRDL
jgi:putative membrane protein (TIGR04086 family)